MTTSGSWRISGSVQGLPSGTRDVDVSIIAPTNAVDVTTTLAATTGFNAVTVPTNATAALIIPDPANTQTIQLKGVTGDTGIPISKTQPTAIALNAATTFGLTVGGNVNITILFM